MRRITQSLMRSAESVFRVGQSDVEEVELAEYPDRRCLLLNCWRLVFTGYSESISADGDRYNFVVYISNF